MARFASADQANPPPRGGIEFIGSSSIRFWESLATDFPASRCSTAASAARKCATAPGMPTRSWCRMRRARCSSTPVTTTSTAAAPPCRCATMWSPSCSACIDLPKTKVEYLSIKPSPSRALLPAINEANTLIKAALAKLPNTGFTDIYTPMLGADGQPDATLFREDMLHMTPAGYAIWTKALAPKVN
jgi:hypothetical protein